MLFKIGVLTNFEIFTGKHLCWRKETPTQVFSCEYCEISKNSSFLTKHLRWLLLYFRDYCTRKHSQKKRKETAPMSFLITIWNLQFKQITFYGDHILWRSQYSHVFLILLSCFSCWEFEKTLVTCNV